MVLSVRVLSESSLGTVYVSFIVNSESIFILRVFALLSPMLYHTHAEAGISSKELAVFGFFDPHHSASA